jgi:hypothetical protein
MEAMDMGLLGGTGNEHCTEAFGIGVQTGQKRVSHSNF